MLRLIGMKLIFLQSMNFEEAGLVSAAKLLHIQTWWNVKAVNSGFTGK